MTVNCQLSLLVVCLRGGYGSSELEVTELGGVVAS